MCMVEGYILTFLEEGQRRLSFFFWNFGDALRALYRFYVMLYVCRLLFVMPIWQLDSKSLDFVR